MLQNLCISAYIKLIRRFPLRLLGRLLIVTERINIWNTQSIAIAIESLLPSLYAVRVGQKNHSYDLLFKFYADLKLNEPNKSKDINNIAFHIKTSLSILFIKKE